MCCLVDLSSWQTKIADDSRDSRVVEQYDVETEDKVSDTFQQQHPYAGGILTLGCCGA